MKLRYKFLELIPTISIATYNDFLYFDEDQRAAQATDGIVISSIGGEINTSFANPKGESFHIENEIIATNVSGGSSGLVRIPDLFYNGRYFWRGLLFEDKIPVQIGIDAHARTSYFANQYNPVTQQFYVQNEFEISAYFKADLFLSMRVDKFYVGVKWGYFNQQPDDGYFVTPYYPGQPRNFDLTIRWTFFD